MSEDQQQCLLTVQGHDTRISQLRHRYQTLPERDKLAVSKQAKQQREQQKTTLQVKLLELQRNLKHSEDDLTALETRIKQENDHLYSGELTATRDLLALQHEIEGLQMRCSEVESEALVLMEQVEQVNAEVENITQKLANDEADITESQQALATAEAAVQAEIDAETDARKAAAIQISAEALADYESLRDRLGGVAVARLRDGICEGCHLALAARELDRIRQLPLSELCHCEECGCILVRA